MRLKDSLIKLLDGLIQDSNSLIKPLDGLIQDSNSLIKLLDGLIQDSNSLIKLSTRNQEPRTKIPRKVLLRILVPGTWKEPRFSTKLFLGILVLGSWFLADSLIKLLDGLIQDSNSLIKLLDGLIQDSSSLIQLSARNQEPRTKIPRKVLLRILVPGTWGEPRTKNQHSQEKFC